VKSFEQLWEELSQKIEIKDPNSATVKAIGAGIHAIGKKVLEEAGEVWLAAEHQSDKELAIEISQLLYQVQVIALARGIKLQDIYKEL